MNGFLELEPLESLKSRLSETGTWFEIFEQLAEHALLMDARGNGTEAEVFYHQCKLYLEQASEGDEHVAGSPSSTIALFWVYLALANLHRYSHMPDYSKAIEYLQLLLSTRAKIASSSEGAMARSYNEIRFALCLTMFEWVEGPKEFDQAAGNAVLNVVQVQEKAQDIVDEWKTLDDVQVSSSLAHMLSLGYAKLQRNDRESHWDQWLTNLKMQYVVTGDPTLDKIPKYPSVEFQRFSKNTKLCLHRFREFGVKAKTARAAGQILEAEQCYGRASLAAAEAIQAHTELGSTIKALKSSIVEVMYERAYDVDFSLDKERETRLIAEAVLEAHKFFPEVYNGSVSDLDLKGFICWHLSKQYEDWGRIGEALFWNEKRLELLEADKKKPLYNYVLLRSIAMRLHLGEDEKARNMIPDVMKKLKKNASDQGSPDAIQALATLPYTSHLRREIFRQTMTADVNEDEYYAEVKWAEQFLQNFKAHDGGTKHEKPDEITKWNLLCSKGKQLMSEDKLEEAVVCFHECLKLITEDGSDAMYYTMECHGLIGDCRSILFHREVQRELQFGIGAYPGNDETLQFMYHFRDSMDNLQKALKVAEQRDDIYNMANYNKMLGFLLYTNWRLVLPCHAKLSKDGYTCLRTALKHHKASGRNLNRLLYGLRDTNALWISVLERHDNVSIGFTSIKESRDVSGPGTVMLEFIKTDGEDKEKFIIYAVTQGGAVRMQLSDKPEEDLEILIKKLTDHMSQKPNSMLPEPELIQILEDLHEAFFAPIQLVLDDMEEHHKLVICANKILAGVPFAVLRNPKTKKFLIESHTIVCTPSLRILKQCNQRLKTLQHLPLMESTGAALVLGDPAFSSGELNRLEFSGVEADTIADILGHQNVRLLKGKSAVKNEVLDWAQLATASGKYQAVMHLATHGKGADDNFIEGALEFANPKVKDWPPVPTSKLSHDMSNLSLQSESQMKTSNEASSSTPIMPLQAQEPAFHGRGYGGLRRRKVDPHHLTSEEIVKDYIWRMLLVVLSACETAKGDVKSEGTLNLARALLISGVPSTIVSKWKVDDASAPILMTGLYRAMTHGMDVASALRASMMDMINKNYCIHQWAPFIVMGLGTVTLPEQFLVQKSI
ncbi:unnamed protein product [Sphagnum jensenii]|uniref:CHAT domain-containing protein n=1 Tax=Sphagnum jensenii TaxID=128206 RepID=A0ABP1B7K9_9BRYO